jgi:hypothetical protein
LLAVDQDEAQRVIEDYLAQHDLDQLYGAALIPALAQAERDHGDGVLDEVRWKFILEFIDELIDDFGANSSDEASSDGNEITSADTRPGMAAGEPRLLIMPAHTPGDVVATDMLAQRLAARDVPVAKSSSSTLAGELLDRVANEHISIVLVVAVSPISELHAKYITKRLRRRFSQIKVLIALWHGRGDGSYTRSRLTAAGADQVLTTLDDVLTHAARLATGAPTSSPKADAPVEVA